MFDCLRSMDCSPPGSAVHGITQARHWSGLPFPSLRGSSRPRDQTLLSALAGRFVTTAPRGSPAGLPETEERGPLWQERWTWWREGSRNEQKRCREAVSVRGLGEHRCARQGDRQGAPVQRPLCSSSLRRRPGSWTIWTKRPELFFSYFWLLCYISLQGDAVRCGQLGFQGLLTLHILKTASDFIITFERKNETQNFP